LAFSGGGPRPLLKNNDWDIRWRAIHVLGGIRDKRACEVLVGMLKDENKYVREAAAIALGEIRDKCAVEPLIKALQDENKYVREEATMALSEIKDRRALEPLIKALSDKDWGVRWGVANALGGNWGPGSHRSLIKALNDSALCQEGAASALQRIGKPAVRSCLRASTIPAQCTPLVSGHWENKNQRAARVCSKPCRTLTVAFSSRAEVADGTGRMSGGSGSRSKAKG
jgi:hypothetical protein